MPIYSLLFRNRWFALAWVGLMLASAAAFVGRDGAAARIDESVDRLKAKREALARHIDAPPVIVPRTMTRDRPEFPELEALPGSNADPRDPQVGQIFVNPVTGQRFRAVRRGDIPAAPAGPMEKSDAPEGTIP